MHFSRIATTPWPPAAQMLITPRPRAALVQRLGQRGDDPPAGRGERVPGGQRAAVDVELVRSISPSGVVAAEPLACEHRVPPRLQRREHLRRERLVDLVQVEVGEARARCGRASAASRRRAPSAGPRPCARGRRPRSGRRRSTPAPAGRAPPPTPRDASSTADAPSDSGVELPAVIVPFSPPKTGLSFASFSDDESGAQVLVALEPEVRRHEVVVEPALVRRGHAAGARRRSARPAPRA